MSIETEFDVKAHKKIMIAGLNQMISLYADTKGRLLNVTSPREYKLQLEIFEGRMKELQEVTEPDDGKPKIEVFKN